MKGNPKEHCYFDVVKSLMLFIRLKQLIIVKLYNIYLILFKKIVFQVKFYNM